MKKIVWFLIGLVLLFVGLTYISVWSRDGESNTAVIREVDDLEKVDFSEYDSVLVAATTLYDANVIKVAMQGENYRKAWATEIKVPVVFLDTLKGGMQILKEGGGSQTHSLRLKAANGFVYSLRSINKDPASHVPEAARTLGLQNIVIDGISAQHPYGSLLVASLAEAANILHTHPQVIFVPAQDFLGEYNNKFGNRLFLLEYETEGGKNWTSLQNVVEIIDTEDLQELKIKEGDRLQIDEPALVRARLFDLLIGDWDRHAKQWGWVVQRSGDRLKAVPLPGDRDNAFFKIGGIVPGILTNKNVQPLVRPFEEKIDHLPGLVYPFDSYFLSSTPEEIFREQAEELKRRLTDRELETALKSWPVEIAEHDGEEILQKIKSRRENLVEYAIEFHKAIRKNGMLEEPLKGSEELVLPPGLQNCFECGSPENSEESKGSDSKN